VYSADAGALARTCSTTAPLDGPQAGLRLTGAPARRYRPRPLETDYPGGAVTNHPERRKATRCPVDFFVQEVKGDRTWLHPALNVSVNGLYVLVSDDERAIDSQQQMFLEFTLPSGALIEAIGHVAYVDDRLGQRGLGIALTELAPEAQLALSRYVDAIEAAQRRLHAIG
jgi:hypothetical protein